MYLYNEIIQISDNLNVKYLYTHFLTVGFEKYSNFGPDVFIEH